MRARGKRVFGHVAELKAFDLVYRLVRQIPPGRVMTYGQLAERLGYLLSPAAVGWALHVCPPDVPWHRVVNAQGGLSTEKLPDFPPYRQRQLLAEEGVVCDGQGRVDLDRYRWDGAPVLWVSDGRASSEP
ncbi:MAG: MGMT family protein [Thermoanaerobaculum sp.]|nr:MGMT family protein [Thermoanaerobaculum sp.]